MVIAGNKLDLCNEERQEDNQRMVSTEQAQKYADNLGVSYFETSAKSGVGVKELMVHIFEKVYLSVCEKERKI